MRRLPVALLVVTLAGCGVDTPCSGEGESFSGKQLGVRCCPGLVHTSETIEPCAGDCEPTEGLPEGCDDFGGGIDGIVCLACGDGVCRTAENFCNCPEDCPRSEP